MDEFAIGGGISECGDTIGRTAKDVGLYPWLGITTPYSGPDKDPWKATPAVRGVPWLPEQQVAESMPMLVDRGPCKRQGAADKMRVQAILWGRG